MFKMDNIPNNPDNWDDFHLFFTKPLRELQTVHNEFLSDFNNFDNNITPEMKIMISNVVNPTGPYEESIMDRIDSIKDTMGNLHQLLLANRHSEDINTTHHD